MANKFSYSSEREIRTFAYLLGTATDAFEKSDIADGSTYQIMSSLVFSAFTLEAYMNHLGAQKIEFWDEIEQIGPMPKLKVICSVLSLEFDPSSRPIQTAKQLFKFRNFMAHAKTEKVVGSGTRKNPTVDPGENLVETEWEKFCNKAEAERGIEDIKQIMETLCEAAGFEKKWLYSLSNGSWRIGKDQT